MQIQTFVIGLLITLKVVAKIITYYNNYNNSLGQVVRALTFHQCSPGSISALSVICGLNLFVLYSAMRSFSPGTPVFPSHQMPAFSLI